MQFLTWLRLADVYRKRHKRTFVAKVFALAKRSGVRIERAELPDWCRIAWTPYGGGAIVIPPGMSDDDAARHAYALLCAVGYSGDLEPWRQPKHGQGAA
jgi:hypothetical protein